MGLAREGIELGSPIGFPVVGSRLRGVTPGTDVGRRCVAIVAGESRPGETANPCDCAESGEDASP